MPRMIVHHEILQTPLQQHAVFVKLYTGSVLDHALDVAMLDLAPASDLDRGATVGSAHRWSAHPRYRRLDRHLSSRLGFPDGAQDRIGGGALVGNASP